jgi:hypothetical protein
VAISAVLVRTGYLRACWMHVTGCMQIDSYPTMYCSTKITMQLIRHPYPRSRLPAAEEEVQEEEEEEEKEEEEATMTATKATAQVVTTTNSTTRTNTPATSTTSTTRTSTTNTTSAQVLIRRCEENLHSNSPMHSQVQMIFMKGRHCRATCLSLQHAKPKQDAW